MRFFVALTVFALGFALYAVAALLFDRRRMLAGWRAIRRARATGQASEASQAMGRASMTVRVLSLLPPPVTIIGFLVAGTLLMLGSCAGLIVW
jgi:hypothetical protein